MSGVSYAECGLESSESTSHYNTVVNALFHMVVCVRPWRPACCTGQAPIYRKVQARVRSHLLLCPFITLSFYHNQKRYTQFQREALAFNLCLLSSFCLASSSSFFLFSSASLCSSATIAACRCTSLSFSLASLSSTTF